MENPLDYIQILLLTSFYGSHVITAAENGGMICTNSKLLNFESFLIIKTLKILLYDDLKNRFNIKLMAFRS